MKKGKRGIGKKATVETLIRIALWIVVFALLLFAVLKMSGVI